MERSDEANDNPESKFILRAILRKTKEKQKRRIREMFRSRVHT